MFLMSTLTYQDPGQGEIDTTARTVYADIGLCRGISRSSVE